MIEKTCKACGGTYPAETDGVQYFHACPASVAPVYRRDENLISTDGEHKGRMRYQGKGVREKGK
jgi:hypothetical protein